ncbi:hypothetical protein BOTBODRAFT_190358 [Botryobasidium botryosum FD-172 SS1]|uniref:Uncharacterized protein n=1 Tax=Botryobasidium botryosum (strain FD-172 SS1) TaxID=930990 RepID=A0A067M575_BOTB1|nr:hypothetical protein BOTBODRAFT_190358 [Botryobasidium botryosum FD-172 SS1]
MKHYYHSSACAPPEGQVALKRATWPPVPPVLQMAPNFVVAPKAPTLVNLKFIDVLKNATPGGSVPDFFHSLQDPSFHPQVITAANEGEILANCKWVDEMIIGHTFFEGDIFIGGLKPPTFNYTVLVEIMNISYGTNRTQAVLDYYKITPDLSSYLLEFAAGYLFGDILLSQDINNIVKQIATTSNDTKPVYYYNFGQQNPIEDSPLFGYAHHEIDLLYLFQDYNPYFYYDYDRYAAVEFGKAWLAFVNGRAPWTPFTIGGGEVAATLRDRVQEFKRADDHYGRYRFWEFLDKLGIDDTVGQFFT